MVCIALSRAAAYALTTGAGCVTARCLSELESEEPKPKATVTSKVFLELEIDGHCAGSVVIGLYGGIAPKTAENFRQLCSGEQGFGYQGTSFAPLCYQGTSITPRCYALQGGVDGTEGRSIYAQSRRRQGFWGRGWERFPDEWSRQQPSLQQAKMSGDGRVHHDEPGVLSMADSRPDSNGSQFLITTAPAQHLDGKHVIFGTVLAGMEVVRRLEVLGSSNAMLPGVVKITRCGVLASDGVGWSAARYPADELQLPKTKRIRMSSKGRFWGEPR